MSLGRNACDGRLVASVRIVHARSRGLTRQRIPFAPSAVSLSTSARGPRSGTASQVKNWDRHRTIRTTRRTLIKRIARERSKHQIRNSKQVRISPKSTKTQNELLRIPGSGFSEFKIYLIAFVSDFALSVFGPLVVLELKFVA
jgi:hypothetical protein